MAPLGVTGLCTELSAPALVSGKQEEILGADICSPVGWISNHCSMDVGDHNCFYPCAAKMCLPIASPHEDHLSAQTD